MIIRRVRNHRHRQEVLLRSFCRPRNSRNRLRGYGEPASMGVLQRMAAGGQGPGHTRAPTGRLKRRRRAMSMTTASNPHHHHHPRTIATRRRPRHRPVLSHDRLAPTTHLHRAKTIICRFQIERFGHPMQVATMDVHLFGSTFQRHRWPQTLPDLCKRAHCTWMRRCLRSRLLHILNLPHRPWNYPLTICAVHLRKEARVTRHRSIAPIRPAVIEWDAFGWVHAAEVPV